MHASAATPPPAARTPSRLPRGLAAPLLVALALLAAATPPTEASGHCGFTITAADHSPPAGTYTRALQTEMTARFSDAPAHCGVADWYWEFNGAKWWRLGTALPEGDHYVMRAQVILDQEAEWTIKPWLKEVCCAANGIAAEGETSWRITINFCNSEYPVAFSPTGDLDEYTPTITATFQRTDPMCPLQSGRLLVDGVVRDTTFEQEGDLYRLSWTPDAPLLPGAHSIRAQATHLCCEGPANVPKTQTVDATFNLLSCGEGRHVAEDHRPQGTIADTRPLIEVAFRDVDRACGVVDFGMSVNGFAVSPEPESLGDLFILRHRPTLPLVSGPQTVTAWVKERCCTSAGTEGGGETAWTFTTVAAPGSSFGHNFSVPSVSSTTTLGGPTYVPGFRHPDVPVGIDGFWLPLPGPVELFVRTSEIPLRVYADPGHTAGETRIPVLDITTITLCPEGSTCPAPYTEAEAGPTTVTVGVRLAGQTIHQQPVTIPIIP